MNASPQLSLLLLLEQTDMRQYFSRPPSKPTRRLQPVVTRLPWTASRWNRNRQLFSAKTISSSRWHRRRPRKRASNANATTPSTPTLSCENSLALSRSSICRFFLVAFLNCFLHFVFACRRLARRSTRLTCALCSSKVSPSRSFAMTSRYTMLITMPDANHSCQRTLFSLDLTTRL